jgi:hypothetical protein
MCQRILIHPRRMYPYHTQTRHIDTMEWLEVRAEQKAVSRPLTPPVVPPSTVTRFSGEAMDVVNRARSPGSQDILIDTKPEGGDYLQVHVERSIIINTEAEDGKVIEKA